MGGVPRWNFDEAGYRKFQRALKAGGHVPDPDPSRLDIIEAKAQSRIDRVAPRADNNPQLKRALQRDEDLLVSIQRLKQGDVTPTPKRRGRPPKGAS
jgi:hypothetical protein